MKNLSKLGAALNKAEQKEIFGGQNPPPPPGLCGDGSIVIGSSKPRACVEGEICCHVRGEGLTCGTPLTCIEFPNG